MKKIKLLFAGLFLILLSSCSQKEVNLTEAEGISISTKAQLKNLQKGESHNVNIEIALIRNQAVRMDVTALFGYKLATVLMTPQKIEYLAYNSKSHVVGPFSSKTLFPIFKHNVDPNILWKAIHDQNPANSTLKCQVDSQQRPTICQEKDLIATWTYQEPPQKKVIIKNSQFEMIWLFKNQTVLDSPQSETFVLKKPEGFREIVVK